MSTVHEYSTVHAVLYLVSGTHAILYSTTTTVLYLVSGTDTEGLVRVHPLTCV
jgi:hypothetical protein